MLVVALGAMCVCVCVVLYTCVLTCRYTHEEVRVEHRGPFCISIHLLFFSWSLLLKAHCFSRADWTQTPGLTLYRHTQPYPAFYMGAGNSYLGLYTCVASTLTH